MSLSCLPGPCHSYIPYFCRYMFPCKAWIDIHKKVKQEYAKVLEVHDVQESKLTTVRSKQLMSTHVNLSFIFIILHN